MDAELDARVTHIDYSGVEGVMLKASRRGEAESWEGPFDAVIVTVPLGHLKRFHSSLFHPPLPEWKVAAVETLGFGHLQKVFLLFDRYLSPEMLNSSSTALALLPEAGRRGLVDHLHTLEIHRWNSSILVAWLSGSNCPRLIDSAEDGELADAVRGHLLPVLFRAMPSWRRPSLVTIRRMRWSEDELFGGSYSYITPEASRLSQRRPKGMETPFQLLAQPIGLVGRRGRVLFAGEATHPSQYQTVPGAYRSGLREADRVLNAVMRKVGAQ